MVRAGLVSAVTGGRITAAEVFDGRSLKRHISLAEKTAGTLAAGHGRTLSPAEREMRATDFVSRITGARLLEPARRGKFLWIPIAGSDTALFAHLAMSGQMLLREPEAPDDKHVRIRLWLETATGQQVRLDFADQRRFGSLAIDQLVPTDTGEVAGWGDYSGSLPAQAAHIARDLLDELFDFTATAKLLKTKHTGIKKLLLNQELLSGIGNIYADEALWDARIHPETMAHRISAARLEELLYAAREVMVRALAEGGTSFDALYVNTQGDAGYFARSLMAYGRSGKPCKRCGTPLKSIVVSGRTSHLCPACQRRR